MKPSRGVVLCFVIGMLILSSMGQVLGRPTQQIDILPVVINDGSTINAEAAPILPPSSPRMNQPETSRAILIEEDFSSGTFPPTGWATQTSGTVGTWSRESTDNAGGASPEARYHYGSSGTGISRLYVGPLDTTGLSDLDVSWRYYLDDYGTGLTMKVQTSSDLSTWNDQGWEIISGGGNLGPELVVDTISTADVGSSTFYMAFTADGNSWQINDWYIDDVQLSSAETPYSIDLTGRSPGWMFISYPITVSGHIETVLDDGANGDNGTQWDVAKVYDNVAKEWLSYRKGGYTPSFTNVTNLMGMWLHITSNGGDEALSILPAGNNPGVESINLYAGWNMVGYPCLDDMTASETVPSEADLVGIWQEPSPYVQDVTDLSTVTLTHGNAYWIHVTADCLWTVETIPPPLEPIRQTAEFERMQGVLIRYPLGIPYDLIVEISEDDIVYTVVSNANLASAQSAYNTNGVNMANCEWIVADSDSYWCRDYGPWWITDENGEFGICDFPYNRPRPDDNLVPSEVASYFGVPLDYMNVEHTGGNYMTDGMGISISTDLVETENPGYTNAEICQLHQDHLGIDTYHIVPDALGEYIEHIDCWAKYLDVDKIMISRDSGNPDLDDAAHYFENQTSAYGTPYQVFRVDAPGGEPYTNCLILNEKVLLPLTGGSWDAAAIATYEAAMPGYEIIGFYGLPSPDHWQTTVALHCRTRGIPDLGMLWILHYPVVGPVTASTPIDITANITAYSGSALTTYDLYWKLDTEPTFNTLTMSNVEGDQYMATIPGQSSGATIEYYIQAQDASGRSETSPFIGDADPHVIAVA